MAYKIQYIDSHLTKKVESRRTLYIKWIAITVVVFVVAGMMRLDAVQDFLIPGNPEITKAAFSTFTQELKAGERFNDAAAAFCRQIIESDNVE